MCSGRGVQQFADFGVANLMEVGVRLADGLEARRRGQAHDLVGGVP